jgi:tRNA(Ile)-lysidine synthase
VLTRQDPEGEFAAAMHAAGPFEPQPLLAVGLSGGADSTALLHLATDWARRRDGSILALTVDHGLRVGSAAEAAEVASKCAGLGIEHRVLVWRGDKPRSAIQARARAVRHALLELACAEYGALHLLLGHHADDQRETIAMRAARVSGPIGLAGMSAIVERRHVRVLRPLLALGQASLRLWLASRGIDWLEDPSNRDPRFLRARMRAGGVPFPPIPVIPDRAVSERRLADWLGRYAAVHPEGWIEFDLERAGAVEDGVMAGGLRAAVLAVSGAEHPPRQAALSSAVAWVRSAPTGARRGFAGCWLQRSEQGLAIMRASVLAPTVPVAPGAAELIWDRRFRLRWPSGVSSPALVGPAGRVAGAGGHPAALAGAALPVPRRLDGAGERAHLLEYGRGRVALVSVAALDVIYRPTRRFAGSAFAEMPAAAASQSAS